MIADGGICTHLLTTQEEAISTSDLLDLIEARPERADPINQGQKLPAHGAAIIMDPETFNEVKTELETACRLLGRHCSLQAQLILNNMDRMVPRKGK